MKKTTLTPQSLSSSALTKRSLPIPAVLLGLLYVTLTLCSVFTFSSWTPVVWIIFIPFYILLLVTSILYVVHWHRKQNLEERSKEEEIKSTRKTRIAELDNQAEQCQLEKDKLRTQEDALKTLLQNPSLSKITCEHNPILGDNVNIEFGDFEKNNTSSKVRRINSR